VRDNNVPFEESFMNMKTAEVSIAYLATVVDVDDWNERTTTLIAMGCDKDVVETAFYNELPSYIEGWDKRYNEWNQEDYDNVLRIYPTLHECKWLNVHKTTRKYINVLGNETEVHRYTIDRIYDYEPTEEEWEAAKLTQEQKKALYKLFGGTWEPNKSTSKHYYFEEVMLVPTRSL
jgi:hypothetical protein